jgi:hypothetical protein
MLKLRQVYLLCLGAPLQGAKAKSLEHERQSAIAPKTASNLHKSLPAHQKHTSRRNEKATDPEARASSSSAMVMGIIALLAVAAAVYFFAMRPAETTAPGSSTTIVNQQPSVPPPSTTVVVP